VIAAKWYLLARAAGENDLALDRVLAQLTPEQRATAEAEAAGWRERVDPTP